MENKPGSKLSSEDVSIFLACAAIVVPLLWLLRNRRETEKEAAK